MRSECAFTTDWGDELSAQPNPEKILQTGLAFWASKTLLSAIELGLFTELAQGREHFDALSGRLGLHPRSARDFLDALVSLGFLSRDGDEYGNTPETDLFLDRKKPSYVGGILEMANHRLYPFWGHLTEALRTGAPQNEVKAGGPGIFETLYADAARLKLFLAAMTGISHGANMAIARLFPWKNYRTFADVGTAQGDPRRRLPSPIRTCKGSASTCPKWGRSSKSTWPRSAPPADSAFSQGASSSRTCRRLTSC